jgi:hypothetical protein
MKPLKSGYRVSIESAGTDIAALTVRDNDALEYAMSEAIIGNQPSTVLAYRTCLKALALVYESTESQMTEEEINIGNAVMEYLSKAERELAARRAAAGQKWT